MHVPFIVIGAGPAGLQAGYFLQKAKKKYLIIEQNDCPGSFFKKHPIHRKLISINKKYTGNKDKDFNLRHDWNSLLNDEGLVFTDYSDEYFPNADRLTDYLQDFCNSFSLQINYKEEVTSIDKKDKFYVKSSKSNYTCDFLLICTGLSPKRIDNVQTTKNIFYYDNMPLTPDIYINKKVLIIGQGNSGFETADYLMDKTASIHIADNGCLRLAWQSHYVGDIRAVNNNFLDTYQLKSLNGLITQKINFFDFKETKNGVGAIGKEVGGSAQYHIGDSYDYIILCIGFEPYTPKFESQEELGLIGEGNRPLIDPCYQSMKVENLYFMGSVMQNIGYRSSPSGFIHGFRYLIRNGIKMLLHKHFNRHLDEIALPKETENLTQFIIKQINSVSGLYQMYAILCDAYVIREKSIVYYPELNIDWLLDSSGFSEFIYVNFEYGKSYGGHIEKKKDLGGSSYVFGIDRAEGIYGEPEKSDFLHPVLYYYKNGQLAEVLHITESLETEWTDEITHVRPLRKFIDSIIG